MTTLNQKALEAAKAAHAEVINRGVGVEYDDAALDEAIAAYLSAITPEDVKGLVGRLLRADLDAVREAASLIQSQAARIAALEAGLEAIAVFPNPPTVSQARALLNKDRQP